MTDRRFRAVLCAAFLPLVHLAALQVALADPPAAPPADPPAAAPPASASPPPTKAENDRISLLLRLPKPNPAGFIGDPYPLDTCIVTGEKLGKDAVTLVLKDQADALQEGRQLKFANETAKQIFLVREREFLTKLDTEIIHRQRASYPLDRDVVEIDRTLTEHFPFVFGNRCYVVMRSKNIDNFLKQAGRYVGTYDKMVGSKQRATYPLDTSLVSGEKLPAKPYDIVIGQRLVRLCSEAEAKTLLEDPTTYLAKLPPLKSAGDAKPSGGSAPSAPATPGGAAK